jgi:hypothetical protein
MVTRRVSEAPTAIPRSRFGLPLNQQARKREEQDQKMWVKMRLLACAFLTTGWQPVLRGSLWSAARLHFDHLRMMGAGVVFEADCDGAVSLVWLRISLIREL